VPLGGGLVVVSFVASVVFVVEGLIAIGLASVRLRDSRAATALVSQ
jgi:hypothetical protein